MSQKIKIVICAGTACYVMGSSDLFLLEESLPPELKGLVELEGVTCLGFCKNAKNGKAPFVTINGEKMSSANLPAVIEKIQELADAEHK